MTKEENRIIKAYIVRSRYTITQLRQLADNFAQIGMDGVAGKIREIEKSSGFNIHDLLIKGLKITD